MNQADIIEFVNNSALTLREAGARFNLTGERIRQIVDGKVSSGKIKARRRHITESKLHFHPTEGIHYRKLHSELRMAAELYGYTFLPMRHVHAITKQITDRSVLLNINSKLCEFHIVEKLSRTLRYQEPCYYRFRIQRTKPIIDFVLVAVGKISPHPVYIFPREMLSVRRMYYIREKRSYRKDRGSRRSSIDWGVFKNAWHLLSNA